MADPAASPTSPKKEKKQRWWRKRNRPTAIALILLSCLLCTLLVSVVLVYKNESTVKTLASYDPTARANIPAGTQNDYLAMEVRVVSVDVDAGVGRVIIDSISPSGRYAVAPNTDFMRQDVALFANGAQNMLPAMLPSRDLEARIVLSGGRANSYPFDEHNATLSIYAATTAELNNTITALATGASPSTNPFIPLKWTLTGGLQSYVITGTFASSVADVNVLQLTIGVSRSGLTKFFSIMIITFMWMISLTMAALVLDVVAKQREVPIPLLSLNGAMLFALPALRGSQPSIGPVGTLGDVLGFFWYDTPLASSPRRLIMVSLLLRNITLVSISFVVLSMYWVQKLHSDAKKKPLAVVTK
ncbi:hypothetical protein RI367_000624 [Sorochytrium milnesiophthora]